MHECIQEKLAFAQDETRDEDQRIEALDDFEMVRVLPIFHAVEI